VVCVIVWRAGKTTPLRRYQVTVLPASMMPTDCESGGRAIEKPCRILIESGSQASELPAPSTAPTRNTLSVEVCRRRSIANAPSGRTAAAGAWKRPSSLAIVMRRPGGGGAGDVTLPTSSGAGSVVIASYSRWSSIAAPTRLRRSSTGIRCVDANSAAPRATIVIGST